MPILVVSYSTSSTPSRESLIGIKVNKYIKLFFSFIFVLEIRNNPAETYLCPKSTGVAIIDKFRIQSQSIKAGLPPCELMCIDQLLNAIYQRKMFALQEEVESQGGNVK